MSFFFFRSAFGPILRLLLDDFGCRRLVWRIEEGILYKVLIFVDQFLDRAFFWMKWLARGFILECVTVFIQFKQISGILG